jgi:hypothetical protein
MFVCFLLFSMENNVFCAHIRLPHSKVPASNVNVLVGNLAVNGILQLVASFSVSLDSPLSLPPPPPTVSKPPSVEPPAVPEPPPAETQVPQKIARAPHALLL